MRPTKVDQLVARMLLRIRGGSRKFRRWRGGGGGGVPDNGFFSIVLFFSRLISQMAVESTVAQCKSAWHETEGPRVRASLASLCCVLEQETFIIT